MSKEATRRSEYSDGLESVLCIALELSLNDWKLAMSPGLGQKPRERRVRAGDLEGLLKEIERGKTRFGLGPQTRVRTCYEAGRDGFWIHRFLVRFGVDNVVVDPSSIEVSRRARRCKTDRLDARKLLRLLLRYDLGEEKVWRVVRVPREADEDARQLHRELSVLTKERTRHVNRIKGLLASVGVRGGLRKSFEQDLVQIRLWDGQPLPAGLHSRLLREWRRIELLDEQMRSLRTERRDQIRHGEGPAVEKVRQLMTLKAIGETSAWLLTLEMYAWREFRNRRQVGAYSGLTPTPFRSGSGTREQGIGKDGNRLVRSLAIEIAWGWLRYQPNSQLSQWFAQRFAHGGPRMRRIGIVALARKLLIVLWRWLEFDELPKGAELKSA